MVFADYELDGFSDQILVLQGYLLVLVVGDIPKNFHILLGDYPNRLLQLLVFLDQVEV